MCKMNVVINKLVLGNRELGWECWNGKETLRESKGAFLVSAPTKKNIFKMRDLFSYGI